MLVHFFRASSDSWFPSTEVYLDWMTSDLANLVRFDDVIIGWKRLKEKGGLHKLTLGRVGEMEVYHQSTESHVSITHRVHIKT